MGGTINGPIASQPCWLRIFNAIWPFFPRARTLTSSNALSVSAEFINQNNNIIISDNGVQSLSEAIEIARDYASKKKFKALCFLPSDLENPLEKDLKKYLRNNKDQMSRIHAQNLILKIGKIMDVNQI